MPTRQGWTVLVAALAAVVVGRVFGVVELYVIGAGFGAAVGIAVAVVNIRRPLLVFARRMRPPVVAAGDPGRVEIAILNQGKRSSPAAALTEPVGATAGARLQLSPLRGGAALSVGYAVPTGRRGVLLVGPTSITIGDVLGLAQRQTFVLGTDEIVIIPRAYPLLMPALGYGVLGRYLLAQSQRIGSSEFHSLRDYQIGDEPRSIHWRASARSEELKVRKMTTEGVRRCLVVLDRAGSGEAFERGVIAAASIVHSADKAGLTTRFVATGDADLRGPEVAGLTLRYLAEVECGGSLGLGFSDRVPGDGLGLVIIITATGSTAAWQESARLIDPSETRIGVFTEGGAPASLGPFAIDATAEDVFVRSWNSVAGVVRVQAATERPPERETVGSTA